MAEAESQSPFRRQALENIATPQALDDFVQITPPAAWALALALWLIAAAIIAWLFFGFVSTHVSGKGIVLNQNEAIIYVSALNASDLKQGMETYIRPMGGEHNEYKRLSAPVTAVETIPSNPQNMLETLKNPSLVNYFLQSGPVVAVHIQLADSLPIGSLIDAKIRVQRQRPISLIMQR
jgi:hypothetical protein